ncbi:MAG: cardiolipin synthase [Verrucomicrobiota bacterium]
MNASVDYSDLLAVLHLSLVLVISIRVIMRRPATGVALTWLFVVSAIPFAGALFYLLIGERRISRRRIRRIAERKVDYESLVRLGMDRDITIVDWGKHPGEAKGMNLLGTNMIGFPTVSGSSGHLISDTEEMLDSIARDVDAAEHSVFMEFYIWNEGGKADKVLDSLIRAASRGVVCRVLVDSLGARPWWKGSQPEKLRQAGVHLAEALPVGLFRTFLDRTDLRVHRKIIVIDGKIAWTGSMNLVDPKYFKQDAGVGEWVDAMARMEGSVIVPLGLTLIGDWVLETDDSIETLIRESRLSTVEPKPGVDIQVVPSGPGETDDGLLQMLLTTVNSADRELVLTTPYFIPDESLLRAMRGAAARGVKVHLILPEKVDSVLTRYASRSYYSELMEEGIQIHLYRGGLLHTKSITADQSITMFGTVNLDMRSIWINYEVALFVYGHAVGEEVRALQQTYIDDSLVIDAEEWETRSMAQRFFENVCRLASPLL